jgi:hypothetical protein
VVLRLFKGVILLGVALATLNGRDRTGSPASYSQLPNSVQATDSGVDTAWVRERIRERAGDDAVANLKPDQLMRPEAVAAAYWALHQQPRDAWTFEQEIRPFAETW